MSINEKREIKFLFIDQPSQSLGLHNGLASVAAMLRDKDCEIKVLDLRNSDIKIDTTGFVSKPKPIKYAYLKSAITEFEPDIIGISVKSTIFRQSQELIKFIKLNFPKTTLLAGGAHLCIDGIEFMEDTLTDIGIIGEAEDTIQELCDFFTGDREISSIKGLIYRQDGIIKTTPPREFPMDLDSLPFPNYDSFSSVVSNNGIIPSYPIVTSRGCPYACTFCLSPIVSRKKWRARSAKNVLEELKVAKNKYKIQRVNFMEDNFNLNIDRAKEILGLMIKEMGDLVIDFLAGLRVEMIDNELIDLIKKARVQCVAIGIESADPEVRSMLKKGVSLEKTVDSVKKLKDAGINTQAFFILGLPGSTYEKDLNSIEFARNLGVTTYWTIANAYPDTEMFEWVKNNGCILTDYKDSSMTFLNEGGLNFDTESYPATKRMEVFERALIATRRFDRLEYFSKGLERHIKISKLISKYSKKECLIYQPYSFFRIIRAILLKLNLYHLLIKNVNPRIIKKIIFWKK